VALVAGRRVVEAAGRMISHRRALGWHGLQTGWNAERRRFGRFALVGVGNFLIDYGLFALLFYGTDLGLVTANSLAVLAAATHSYLVNKVWTFHDRSRGRTSLQRYGRFLVFTGLSLGLANATIWLLAWLLPVALAKLGSIALTIGFNYWTSRRFVYRPSA
jgi:putative flippase GtrA